MAVEGRSIALGACLIDNETTEVFMLRSIPGLQARQLALAVSGVLAAASAIAASVSEQAAHSCI